MPTHCSRHGRHIMGDGQASSRAMLIDGHQQLFFTAGCIGNHLFGDGAGSHSGFSACVDYVGGASLANGLAQLRHPNIRLNTSTSIKLHRFFDPTALSPGTLDGIPPRHEIPQHRLGVRSRSGPMPSPDPFITSACMSQREIN